MEGLKAIVDSIERLLYEVFGLAVPGAAIVLAVVRVLGDPWWSDLLSFIDSRTWLAVSAGYVLGYVVQGISHPVTITFGWLLFLPVRLVLILIGLPSRRLRQWINVRLPILRQRLLGLCVPDRSLPDDAVDLTDLAESYWTSHLTVPSGKRLSKRQVECLSFSVLLPERKYLDRYRAAASLSRGVAVAVVVVFSLLLYQIIVGVRPLSMLSIVVLVGLLIMFYGLM